ncbi:MAG: hypothetical protein AAGU11_09075 [Syntrophobacteraceae bacterium]
MIGIPKRIFIIILLMLCCPCDNYNIFTESSIKHQAKAFVDEVVPRVAASWDTRELTRHFHSELVRPVLIEQTDQLFFHCMKLGPLVNYDGSKTQVTVTESTVNSRKIVFFDYVAKPRFEKGEATITLRIVKEASEWKILHFSVDSESFKSGEKLVEAQKEGDGKDTQFSREQREQLEEFVQQSPRNEIVQLRKVADRVFELARIHENEGNDRKAIELYERALQADPANLPSQLSFAKLLLKNDRKEEGISRLRYIRDFAKEDTLLRETLALLGTVEEKHPRKVVPPAFREDVEIVVVPIGNPSGQILSELRSALQDRTGIRVSISDQAVDRDGALCPGPIPGSRQSL